MDNRNRVLFGASQLRDFSEVERRVRQAGELQEPEDCRPGLAQGRRSSFAARLRERGGGRVRAKAVRVEMSLLALVKVRKEEAEDLANQTCESFPSREEVLQSVMRQYKEKTGSAASPLPLSQLSTATHTRTHSLSISPGKALSPVLYQFAKSRGAALAASWKA